VTACFVPAMGRRPSLRTGLAALVLCLVAAGFWWWNRPPSEPPDDSTVQRASVVLNPGYVGPTACAPCHAERVADFGRTRHQLACVVPTAEMMPAAFLTGGTVQTPDRSLHFEMSHVAGAFVQTTVRETESGEERTTSPIAYVYGSGGVTDEVYFTWHGDRLFELPAVWLNPLGDWGTSLFDPRGTGDFSREMTIRCVECHNTWFEHVPGTLNEYRREGAILGVTCERCHGPAEAHVAGRQPARAPQRPNIVHPGRLSRDRQIDICAQCHSNTIKPRGRPFTYMPGEPLEVYFKAFETRRPEDDHVANQVGYLRQSLCFAKSESLTCTTCHDPHKAPALDKLSAGRAACIKCHESSDCQERARLPEAIRDSCVECHMPRGNKIQVNFRTAREEYYPPAQRSEHRIGVYPFARDEVLLGWYRSQSDGPSARQARRLEESLASYWLNVAEERKSEHRYLAAVDACRSSLRFDGEERARPLLDEMIKRQTSVDADWADAVRLSDAGRHREAISVLERLIENKPELAKAHGKLGMLYAIVAEDDRARQHLERVAELDPNDAYGVGMLGWLAYLKGDAATALEYYHRADEMEPQNARIQRQIGLALMKLGRWSEAGNSFRRLLEIEPQNVDGFDGLIAAFRQEGHVAEAVEAALRGARATEYRHPGLLLSLAEVYLESGRLDDAESTLRQAGALISQAPADAVSRLEARQRTIQARIARRRK